MAAPRLPLSNRSRVISVIAATAFFMEMLDSTILVTAMPHMAQSFGVSPVSLSLGLTAYMLAIAVFIPLSGWVADRIGPRTTFCAAIGLFTFASLLCALSQTLPQFVAARVLQGVGGAMMSPVGRLILLRIVPREELVRAINFMTVPGLIGGVLGPPLGGFLAEHADWRWIFLINLPIGLLGAAMVLKFVDEQRLPPRRFDFKGFLLNGCALAGLLYGVDLLAGHGGADWRLGVPIAAVGALVGVFAWRHASGAPQPLISLAPLKVKTFAVTTGHAGLLFRAAIAGPIFSMPLLLQIGLGLSATTTGLLILLHAVGDIAVKGLTVRSIAAFGFRTVLIGSGAVFCLAISACLFFTPATPIWLIALPLALAGAARSFQMGALTSLQFADIPPEQTTDASTLGSVLQQTSRAFGVSLIALTVNAFVALSGAEGPDLAALRAGLAAAVILGLLPIFAYRTLAADAGAALSGRGPSA